MWQRTSAPSFEIQFGTLALTPLQQDVEATCAQEKAQEERKSPTEAQHFTQGRMH